MWKPSRQRQRVVVFLSLWFAVAAVWTAWDYVRVSQLLERDEQRAEERAAQQVDGAIEDIDGILTEVQDAARSLASRIPELLSSSPSSEEGSPRTLSAAVEQELSDISGEKNAIFGLGAAFDPEAVRDLFPGEVQGKGKPKPKPEMKGRNKEKLCIGSELAESLYAPYLRRMDDASPGRTLVYLNEIYDYTCQDKYWYACPLSLYPEECDFRLMEAPDAQAEEFMIEGFRSELASMKDACAVRIVRSGADSHRWIVAGFGDDGQFRTIEIKGAESGSREDFDYEFPFLLAKEQKNRTDRSRIVELATASLGRTHPSDCPHVQEAAKGMWLEPYFGEASQRMVEEFAVPFYRPRGEEQGEEPIGVAWANMSLHELSDFLASLDIGSMGYSFLLSAKGVFIAHPRESQTDRARNIGDAARRIKWPELVQYFWAARDQYDLRLVSVSAASELVAEATSLVIIALVGTRLHIRIFDASGERIVDKAEEELTAGETLTGLRQRLTQLPDTASLSEQDKRTIIAHATSVAGHIPPNGVTLDMEETDPLSGEDAWWYFRKVPIDGQVDWVLGIVVLKDELMGRSKDDRRRLQMSLAISILLSALPLVLLLIVLFNREVERSFWWASMSVSIGLLLAIGTIWALALRYPHYAGTSPSPNRHHLPSSECDLRVMEADSAQAEQEEIRKFEAEFESKKKRFFEREATYQCGVLIIRRTVDGAEQRTVAAFNDAREFRTVVIGDPKHELWKEWGLLRDLSQDENSEELWKEKGKVVDLAKSSLGRGGATERMGLSGSDQWAPKILSQAQLDRFKKRYGNYLDTQGERRKVVYLPTGLYVQSLQFVEANAVRATGYVWQQLPPTDEACKGNAPKGREPPDLSFQVKRASENERAGEETCTTVTAGVLFPEATSATVTEAYRESRDDGGVTIGWEFDVTLRETFGYTNYPFDVENVWLRLWHKEINSDVVLVPDLPAYPSVAPSTLPGLEAKGDFVLPDWDLESAFFGYRGHSYSSDFGLKGYSGEEDFPELYFNILVKRRFLGPFISNVMPVLVVAAILFALVLTITRKEESSILGFNTSAVLASCAGLFFGILIGHTELRSALHASGLVYIETFYLIMYGALLLMAVNTYVFSVNERVRILQWRDNLLPKLLYWPTLLLLVLGITWASFY